MIQGKFAFALQQRSTRYIDVESIRSTAREVRKFRDERRARWPNEYAESEYWVQKVLIVPFCDL